MKNLTCLLLFISICVCGCDKEKPDVGVPPGESEYYINGLIRTPKHERMLTNNSVNDAFDLDFPIYDASGGWPVESFYIFKVPMKTGQYPLSITNAQSSDRKTGAFYYTLSDQGDVLEEVYILDENASGNQINVTYFKNKTAAGHFTATFIIDPERGKRNPQSADVIKITGGEFYLTLE